MFVVFEQSAVMAACTATHSTALAGQTALKSINELSRKVGNVQARVTMRKASSSDSIWYCDSSLASHI